MHDTLFNGNVAPNRPKPPIGLYVESFRGELEAFKASLPLDIQQESE